MQKCEHRAAIIHSLQALSVSQRNLSLIYFLKMCGSAFPQQKTCLHRKKQNLFLSHDTLKRNSLSGCDLIIFAILFPSSLIQGGSACCLLIVFCEWSSVWIGVQVQPFIPLVTSFLDKPLARFPSVPTPTYIFSQNNYYRWKISSPILWICSDK